MFDLRYHVASLAPSSSRSPSGIVIGVAIASGGGGRHDVDEIRSASADKDPGAAARERPRSRPTRQRGAGRTPAAARSRTPTRSLMDRAARGRRVSPSSSSARSNGGVRSAVEQTLHRRRLRRRRSALAALELPLDAEALASTLAGRAALAAYAGDGGSRSRAGARHGVRRRGRRRRSGMRSRASSCEEQVGSASSPVDVRRRRSLLGAAATDGRRRAQRRDAPDRGAPRRPAARVWRTHGLPVVGVEPSATTSRGRRSSCSRDAASRASTTSTRCPAGLRSRSFSPAATRATTGTKDSAPDGVSPPHRAA